MSDRPAATRSRSWWKSAKGRIAAPGSSRWFWKPGVVPMATNRPDQ
ncbi:hypothetical protein OG349_13480 [Streptomyces sp. NBC_01317]|nr:hypothetical protein OG349_13480 [Streptomyces sp. NBC_01317]